MNIYFQLFITFAKIGVCTFGGGYAMLPILQREVVENRRWATDEDLTDCFAIGQCTPGIIAVNTATFIGSKQKGILGGILATLGLVFPSLIIIVLVAAGLSHFQDNAYVVHAFNGIRACVCVLIFNAVIKLAKSSLIDVPSVCIFGVILVLSVIWGITPAVLVFVGGLTGFVIHRIRQRRASSASSASSGSEGNETCESVGTHESSAQSECESADILSASDDTRAEASVQDAMHSTPDLGDRVP